MVFSQTSQKPHSVLKVVELDRLKSGKDLTAVPGGSLAMSAMSGSPAPAVASTSFSEVYLKSEPDLEERTMYHRSADCEFFQDLDLWCSAPAKEEQVQTIDSIKPTEDNVLNTDTLSTLYQPPEWDGFDVNSPTAPASFYCGTPQTLSPSIDVAPAATGFLYPGAQEDHFQEKFLDIGSLPVVIGNYAAEPWHPHTLTYDTHKQTFIDEDSLDAKLVAVGPQQLGWGDVALSELVADERPPAPLGPRAPLRLDLRAPGVSVAPIISTPEVVSYVEQLEKQDPSAHTQSLLQPIWPQEEMTVFDLESPTTSSAPPYEPITPKTEAEESEDEVVSRKRRLSNSSDESYTPHIDKKTRKYKRRKPSLPIKEMIQALEEAQPVTKARRGRPPKRRDSALSSVCSFDTSTDGNGKYREIRDKNNEASKRSRMNRKLKELQMEQLAIDLEERNKKLQVKADILEDMTKRLKDALMSAILKQ